MRIVGISGAQGGGKTSLLNELKLRGYEVDEFKVSRAVQAQLGWKSLDNVMDNFSTMVTFQDEVYNQKLENDLSFSTNGRPGLILTERTFADVFAYAQLWAYKLMYRGDVPEMEGLRWVNEYYRKCAEAQVKCYAGTLLLPLMNHVKFEDDPHRAKKEDVQRVYEEVQRFCDLAKYRGHKSFAITQMTVEHRANEVEGLLKMVAPA